MKLVGFNFTRDEKEYTDSSSGPSFISYVHPTEKATFAVYRHQLMNLKTSFGYLTNYPDIDFDVDLRVNANTVGFGFGVKALKSLSLGVSAGFTEMDFKERSDRVDGTEITYEETDGRDQTVHYSASLLWQPTENLGVGLVYRQGPKFTFRKKGFEQRTLQVISDSNGNGFIDFGDFDTNGDGTFDAGDAPTYEITTSNEEVYNFENEVKMPDVYGLGLSYRILPNLTVAADVNYVEYSDLEVAGGTDPDSMNGYEIDNTFEIHAGLEYVADLGAPLALRCGYFYKPGHRLHITPQHENYNQMKELFSEGDPEHIYSLGIGTIFSDNVQIDLAGTFGELIKEGTMSLVYRFE